MRKKCAVSFCVSQLLFLLAGIVLTQIIASTALAQETVLYSFKNTTDGNFPYSGVILDNQGNLYGTTVDGGNLATCDGNGCGEVFEIHHNSDGTWSDRSLYAFAGGPGDGAASWSTVMSDSRGHLFGTTYYGGNGTCSIGQYPGCGVVYELTHSSTGGWTENVLYNFQGGTDGAYPQTPLVMDNLGNLYGTTTEGGGSSVCLQGTTPLGCGTVFELSPSSGGGWTETVLWRFQGNFDGAYPGGGVLLDGAGSVYGTAGGGGSPSCRQYFKDSQDCGLVYKLRHSATGWVRSTPYRFQGGTDGWLPLGELVMDASGNLYGTTDLGGITSPPFGNGTVYELTPSGGGWMESVLYRFTGFLDGGYPIEGVTFDASGNMFGLVNGGGTNSQDGGGGTLYELTPSAGGWTETTIVSFQTQTGGQLPEGKLVRDSSGNLYGAAPYGGAVSTNCSGGCGVVFEATP